MFLGEADDEDESVHVQNMHPKKKLAHYNSGAIQVSIHIQNMHPSKKLANYNSGPMQVAVKLNKLHKITLLCTITKLELGRYIK